MNVSCHVACSFLLTIAHLTDATAHLGWKYEVQAVPSPNLAIDAVQDVVSMFGVEAYSAHRLSNSIMCMPLTVKGFSLGTLRPRAEVASGNATN
eukprot:145952-Pleurochrysis_carterae.AAC.2